MFTTIEPRLIALLNEPTDFTPISPSLELPPLHDHILTASGRPLILEPDASKRSAKQASGPQLQHPHRRSTIDDDEAIHQGNEERHNQRGSPMPERTLGGSSPQSLRKILGDDGPSSRSTSKKRHLVESNMDEFVQLPQPPKKQKAVKQVVPPIIIGLFEPPLQATLFPPIAESSFNDDHRRNTFNTELAKARDMNEAMSNHTPANVVERKKPKDKTQVKARKKWTEEETNNLLLGVHKHGVGRWSDILEDPAFPFNGRSGVDLKDRFRTCCPVELQGENRKSGKLSRRVTSGRKGAIAETHTSGLMSENILIGDDDSTDAKRDETEALLSSPAGKSRTHRKGLTDLMELGIDGPFRKSIRRERQPFTDTDDRAILEGYNIYGPAWTRIQRDPQFHLEGRQPTDLRDRFRNKYPEKFRAVEESVGGQKTNRQNNQGSIDVRPRVPSHTQSSNTFRERLTLDQIISTDHDASGTMGNIRQPQWSLWGLKDAPSEPSGIIEPVDALPFNQSFDWTETITAPFPGNIGEMDISRLLLDEP